MTDLLLETVTPDMARRWIIGSHQIKFDMGKVRRYSSMMGAGQWQPDMHKDAPVLMRDGMMMNGNHRSLAVVLSNAPQLLWVKYG